MKKSKEKAATNKAQTHVTAMFPIDTSPSDVVRRIMESQPRSFPINVLDLKRETREYIRR